MKKRRSIHAYKSITLVNEEFYLIFNRIASVSFDSLKTLFFFFFSFLFLPAVNSDTGQWELHAVASLSDIMTVSH